MAIPASQLAATLQQITGQQINLVIGSRTVPVDSTTIKSWLHIVTDKKTQTAYIHLNESEIGPSIGQLTSRFAKSPVNQVTVTHPDGTQAVIVGGRDGINVGDTGALAKQLAPNVLSGKGTQFNIPLQTVPFQAVSATSFDKLIEVNVVSKQMYLYDKGNFTRQYPISAGAPATPTPLGQFKVYSKLPLQDMKGFNPDGSKYFQPNVRWISYFKAGGYAVHGNYWRPTSWFGAINSSHGCVSLPEDQAKVVYDWTTIGTTVIVHT
jgi:lipoprotein-anchoring transpeptidase ErfK/SrfK